MDAKPNHPTPLGFNDPIPDQYETWNVPALLTGIGGLLSALCFFSTTLCFIPILTLLLGLVTYWSVRKSPEQHLGLWFAWGGVCLACYWLATVGTKEYLSRQQLLNTAQQVAEQWLTYQKAGQPLVAFDLTRKTQLRFLETKPIADLLASNDKEQSRRAEQLAAEPYVTLERVGPTIEWRWVNSTWSSTIENKQYLVVNFMVTYVDRGTTRTAPIEFIVERGQYSDIPEPLWTIFKVQSPTLNGPAK